MDAGTSAFYDGYATRLAATEASRSVMLMQIHPGQLPRALTYAAVQAALSARPSRTQLARQASP